MNRRVKQREATPEEILGWLIQNKMVVLCERKDAKPEWRMTIRGLLFTASRPPHQVTKYIPGAEEADTNAVT